MRRALALLVAGLVLGAILGSTLPATAHHNDLKFKNRLSKLETKVSTLQAQMRTQQQKTFWLDTEGNYGGLIISEQVLGMCAPGSTATWEVNGIDPTIEVQWIDDCFVGQDASAQMLELLKRR
jgi:hypothetical protein